MNLLALETSTEYLSLAVQCGSQCFAMHEQTGAAASQRILPEVARLLAESGLGLSDLDGIIYGMGPGAFTGVRVAVGVAQGLAFGANVPVVGISSLLAVAQAAWQNTQAEKRIPQKIIVCLDARMGEVYHAAFVREDNHWQTVSAPVVCKPDAVPALQDGDWWAAGSGWSVFTEVLSQQYPLQLAGVRSDLVPDARVMLSLAMPAFVLGQTQAAHEAAPLYVRNRVALTAAERAQGQTL